MPVSRSLHFLLAVVFFSAAVFARYQGAEARKIEVSCSCTKSPSNAVVKKFAKCESGTYYTACCNRQHQKFNCTFSATKKENELYLGSSRPEIGELNPLVHSEDDPPILCYLGHPGIRSERNAPSHNPRQGGGPGCLEGSLQNHHQGLHTCRYVHGA